MAAIDFHVERREGRFTYSDWCASMVLAERRGVPLWPLTWTLDRIEKARVTGIVELGEVGT